MRVLGNDATDKQLLMSSSDGDCLVEDVRDKRSFSTSAHARGTDAQRTATSHHHTVPVCTCSA